MYKVSIALWHAMYDRNNWKCTSAGFTQQAQGTGEILRKSVHKITTKQYDEQTKSMKDASFVIGSVVYSFR